MIKNIINCNNTLQKAAKLYYLANTKLRKEPYKYIFILGHMRSGSSLLVHILNTNPDICGYGEAHLSYQNNKDLNQLVYQNKLRLKQFKTNEKYVVDKILHNNHKISQKILDNQDVYFIFLYRDPQKSLSSMINLYKNHQTPKEKQSSLDYYFDYYVHRLQRLQEYASLINDKNRCIAFSYTDLVKNTDVTFYRLKSFLSLKHDFKKNYQILGTTGIKGIGDSSNNIKSGKILNNTSSKTNVIPSNIWNCAEEKYTNYLNHIKQYCLYD